MKIEIENLKGLVYLKDLNNYQRSLAINEFNRLVDYVNELEQLTIPVVSVSFTLDDMRKAFLGGRDSVEAELKCERYGDMDFYASKKIVKSFKTFIHENYR